MLMLVDDSGAATATAAADAADCAICRLTPSRAHNRLLIERRLNKCREIIEDPKHKDRSIGDIALFHGFRNLSDFTSVFKDYFGVSPSEHRSLSTSIERRLAMLRPGAKHGPKGMPALNRASRPSVNSISATPRSPTTVITRA